MGVSNGDADFSLRIFWSVARYIEETKGKETLAWLAAAADVTPEDFDATTRWVSLAQMETLFSGARGLCGDDETFRTAVIHRFAESYGAFRHMVWAVSTERMCQLAVSMSNKVITRVSHFDVLYATPTTFGFRYTSTKLESRLMCLSRIYAWGQAPLLRGVPEAEITEGKCIAKGDDCCEYHLRWLETKPLRSFFVGLGLGAAAAVAAHFIEPSLVSTIALPLFGLGLGYAYDQRTLARKNVDHSMKVGESLRTLGETEAETRSEIVALQQRQHDWSARMEQEASERDAKLDRVVRGLDSLHQSRASSLRGFSHDLRNPLFVVRANGRILRERIAEAGSEDADILDDIETATGQIETMLGRLMDLATAEPEIAKLAPQPIPVAPLVDTMRRRLRALVHGRGIEVFVLRAATAPEEIVVDPLVFDRVTDNLLTNAAKYTDRGRISLTLRGSSAADAIESGALVLELADTGRGIAKERMNEVFRPRDANAPREKDSYGVGLSSAVRLLGQIGGRLDVRSDAGAGSVFSVQFPCVPSPHKRASDEDHETLVARVVRVLSNATDEAA